jgi:hypothetical protein
VDFLMCVLPQKKEEQGMDRKKSDPAPEEKSLKKIVAQENPGPVAKIIGNSGYKSCQGQKNAGGQGRDHTDAAGRGMQKFRSGKGRQSRK